jgi:hypothetical protein
VRWPWQKKHAERHDSDPRGGVESVDADYVTADPRSVVESDGTAMAGPGGAPQDGTTPDERRDAQRP